ncbi:hypothetical protein, partial [Mesotoga prima]|uniref:hypothetical protein n=1 Tax=Mesotoga prima TaxID=1184387 RepID=UPI002FD8AE94
KEEKSRERPDSFEYEGERYSKKDPYKKLTGLAQELRNKDEKLPYDDYQKLRGWIEDRDRNRWQGALEKGLSQAKNEMRTPERPRTTEVAGGKMIDPLQAEMMRNPVVGMFMVQAGIANELVRSIELTDRRDLLKEGREDLEKGSKELEEKEREQDYSKSLQEYAMPWERAEEKIKRSRERVGKGLEETKKAEKQREEQRKKDREKQERDDRDREWFERGGGWGR